MPVPPPIETDWLEAWSWPSDTIGRVALSVGALLVVMGAIPGGARRLAAAIGEPSLVDLRRRRRFLAIAAAAAAFLSLGYVAVFLQGGPRAAEAAIYWLQGRALTHGSIRWAAPEPLAAFHTQGLILPSPDREAGPFPAGYPALLALGFLVGAPMVVGPVLAAGVVFATFWAGRELAEAAAEPAERADGVGRAAAGLSIACAAMRYHTADALPFGAAALGVAVAFAATLRASRTKDARLLAATGGALGAVAALQPTSAIAIFAVAAALAVRLRVGWRALALAIAAAVPGLAVLALTPRGMAGTALGVAGAAAAPAEGLAHRALDLFRAHLLDVANFEPIALFALIALVGSRRTRWAGWAAAVVGGQFVVACLAGRPGFAGARDIAPGEGAAALAAVLPIGHVLVALGLARAFPRHFPQAAIATIGLSLIGFGLHGIAGHQRLAIGDGGRPRFEPDAVREAGVEHGLLFFDDDVGTELARDPGLPASHGVEAVRMRGDDHDRLVFDLLGHPPTHRYLTPVGRSSVVPWSPPGEGNDTWRFETESDWPPVSIQGGTAETSDERPSCASGGHVFVLTPRRSEATATVELPVPRSSASTDRRTWIVTPRVFERGTASQGNIALVTRLGGEPLAQWTWADAAKAPTCVDLAPTPVELGVEVGRAWLVLTARGGPVAVDRTLLRAR
jgi:hypothetical protein